ncbi:MAG TPA: MEDS domain-containing protein, partial [Chloroflexota bacterium]|nr:MEDS domain-containing protein [Chloroflexota bacterium]
LAVLAPFIAYGIARGEQCLCISGDLPLDQVAAALTVWGVDVPAEQERGALTLKPSYEDSLPPGGFDPEPQLAFVRGMAQDAVAAGYAGLRLAADMSWTRGLAIAKDTLITYEAKWNELVATNPIVGLCPYPRPSFEPIVLRDMLRTHPLALLDHHLCANLYYEPPSLVLDPTAMAERVDWMMSQILRAHLAEDSLREAETRYRGIFESTSDGLIVLDLDGRIVEVNPALCRMHGYSREELIGRTPTVLIDPDHGADVAALLRAVTTEGALHCRLVDRRKDGSRIHVEIEGTRFSYQSRPHLLWVVRDVTAQVEAYQLLEQRVAERTRELTTLLAVARDMASTLELEPLLQVILEQLRRVVDYNAATIRVVQGRELIAVAYQGPAPREQLVGRPGAWSGYNTIGQEVIRGRAPVIIDDTQGDTPLVRAFQEGAGTILQTTYSYGRSWLGVPLLLKERVLGMLSLTHATPGYYTSRHAELAMAVASHLAVAMENARLYQQVHELAITEERSRIAREVHDSLAQVLFYVNTQAEAALRLVRTGQTERAAEQIGQLAQAARDAYADVREDILALRTAGATHSLLESLTAYLPLWQEQSGVRSELHISPDGGPMPVLSPAAEIQLVRIVQEALANVRKHAHARRVQIRISADAEQVTLVVEDDGIGFNPTVRERSSSPRFGLAMMRERAAEIGGRLEIDSTPGDGTRVIVHVPAETAPRSPAEQD